MKLSELKGRAVVNVEDATKIGEVENLLLDPVSRQLVGLKVKTGGLFSTALILAVAQIMNIGPDAVTVKSDPANPNQADNFKEAVELTAVLGNKVVTDAGAMIGEVRDILLDPVSGAVSGYEVRQGGMFSQSLEISATPEIRYGEKLITVPAPLPS